MSAALQQRARAFLARPIPGDLDYVRGSIAERVIAQYADTGELDADSEFAELLELTMMEAAAAVEAHEGPAKDYLAESAQLLAEIDAEFRR